jgi:hypothetical protein
MLQQLAVLGVIFLFLRWRGNELKPRPMKIGRESSEDSVASHPPALTDGSVFRSSLKDRDDDTRRFRDMSRCSDQKT